MKKPIIIKQENYDKINTELIAVQVKVRSRVVYFTQLLDCIDELNKKFARFSKKSMNGLTIKLMYMHKIFQEHMQKRVMAIYQRQPIYI